MLPRPLHLGIYWYDIGPPGLKILDTWCIRLCPLALSHDVCAASLCDCYSRSRSRCADKSVRGLVRNSKMCSKIRGWVAVLYVNGLLTMVQTYCAVVQLIDAQCELTNFQQCLCSNTTLQSQVAGCAFYKCSIPDQGGMLALESLKPRPWSEHLN